MTTGLTAWGETTGRIALSPREQEVLREVLPGLLDGLYASAEAISTARELDTLYQRLLP